MKKLLLILVAILSALGMSACQTREEPTNLNAYDYCLLVVVSRQRLSKDTFIYVLQDASTPETSDSITYESELLWSVGEFVIAIELDEEGNIYFTDLDTTTDMIVDQYYELKMNYYEERYGVDLDDTPEDFEKFLYDNYRELYDYMEEMK